jgi:hypothetical protein
MYYIHNSGYIDVNGSVKGWFSPQGMARKADEVRLPHRPSEMLVANVAVAQSISGRPRPRLMVDRSALP